jgi:hypothetical protein
VTQIHANPGDEAGEHSATPAQKIKAGFPPAEESRPEKPNPSNQLGLDGCFRLESEAEL